MHIIYRVRQRLCVNPRGEQFVYDVLARAKDEPETAERVVATFHFKQVAEAFIHQMETQTDD